MTFPLLFEVYKPRERLKPEDKYLTKPQIAAMLMRKLKSMGFKFNLVLADSLYGEQRVGRLCRLEATANPKGESGSNFISVLDEMNLNYMVAIRSNHDTDLLPTQHTQYARVAKI
ncbi:hypothetical protein NSMS1_15920 [Nostoc sp. MS1]|nr:hypothetical protein NSMS1_15920 [Nostoc sp. MS1]